MTTAPTIPAATITSSISGYLKAHETLIIVIILAGLSFIGYNKWLGYQAEHDKQVSNTAMAVAQAQAAANATLAQQAASQLTKYNTLASQLVIQNKSL